MNHSATQRSRCRVCNSGDLHRFLELSDIPLMDDLLKVSEIGSEFLYPLQLYVCECCHLVQTQHDVQVEGYYKDYSYAASLSPLARRFMQLLAVNLFKRFDLQRGETVLDVGSSDGYQLSCFRQLGARVFGFEPALKLAETARKQGIPVAQTVFEPGSVSQIPPDFLPVRVVVSTYTLDHMGDPLAFLELVRQVLDPRHGLLVIEVHDLAKIIERREYCLFAHDHLAYYSAATMSDVLQRGGFDLIALDVVPEHLRRGNSLLVVAAPQGSIHGSVVHVGDDVGHLSALSTYAAFGCEVEASLARFAGFVRLERARGRRLAGYGVVGRGISTLAMSNLTVEDVDYICDSNASFHGCYTPKSHLPVVGPQHLLEDFVDEVVVFSFGYLEEISARLAEYQRLGGRLLSLLELL